MAHLTITGKEGVSIHMQIKSPTGYPTLQQPSTTCNALSNFQYNGRYVAANCTANPSCLSVRCIDPTFSNTIPGVYYYGINLLPCSNPPAVQVLLVDTDSVAQINATVSMTTSGIPLATSNVQVTATITMELNQDRTSFDFMVSQ